MKKIILLLLILFYFRMNVYQQTCEGFNEVNSSISIEAEHFTSKTDCDIIKDSMASGGYAVKILSSSSILNYTLNITKTGVKYFYIRTYVPKLDYANNSCKYQINGQILKAPSGIDCANNDRVYLKDLDAYVWSSFWQGYVEGSKCWPVSYNFTKTGKFTFSIVIDGKAKPIIDKITISSDYYEKNEYYPTKYPDLSFWGPDETPCYATDTLSVSFTNPVDSQKINTSNILLQVEASVKGKSQIKRIEFWTGRIYLGNDSIYPYSFNWTNIKNGSYTLYAKLYTSNNQVKTSTSRILIVNNPATKTFPLKNESFFSVYPTKCNKTITVCSPVIPIKLNIINIKGQNVLSTTIYQKSQSINLENLIMGMYFIRLYDNNNKYNYQVKIIKE